jgi:hypothetical protein
MIKINKKEYWLIIIGSIAAYYIPKITDYLLVNLPILLNALINTLIKNIIPIFIIAVIIYFIKHQK